MRVVDEVIDLGVAGVALLTMEGEPCEGMKLRDALGRVHTVASVSSEGALSTLHIPDGEASYFERLFRNIFVDATLFEEVE